MNRMPPKVPRPAPAPRVVSPYVQRLLEELEKGTLDKETLVQQLAQTMAQNLPLYEKDAETEKTIVTFFYQDVQAEQVLIFVNRLTDEKNLPDSLMDEILDTGIFTISFLADEDWRASYCFIPAYPGEQPLWLSEDNQVRLRHALDRGNKDPYNPLQCLNRAGRVMSVVDMPQAPEQPYNLSLPEIADLPETTWNVTENGRRVALIELGETTPTSPIFFILDGEVWAAMGLHASAALAHQDGNLPACYLVMVDSGGRETRWGELDGSAPYADYLEQELIPWLTSHGVEVSPTRTYIAGQSLGGLTSLLSAVERPDLFAGAIAQSSSLWQPVVFEKLTERIEQDTCSELEHLKIIAEVGKQEWVLVPPHQTLVELFDRAKVPHTYIEYNGGHDYACWRGSLLDHMVTMLTESTTPEEN